MANIQHYVFHINICHKNIAGHRCSVKGCGDVIVLDGNMKNARTVCSCDSVGELVFEGIGNVVIGKCTV